MQWRVIAAADDNVAQVKVAVTLSLGSAVIHMPVMFKIIKNPGVSIKTHAALVIRRKPHVDDRSYITVDYYT